VTQDLREKLSKLRSFDRQ